MAGNSGGTDPPLQCVCGYAQACVYEVSSPWSSWRQSTLELERRLVVSLPRFSQKKIIYFFWGIVSQLYKDLSFASPFLASNLLSETFDSDEDLIECRYRLIIYFSFTDFGSLFRSCGKWVDRTLHVSLESNSWMSSPFPSLKWWENMWTIGAERTRIWSMPSETLIVKKIFHRFKFFNRVPLIFGQWTLLGFINPRDNEVHTVAKKKIIQNFPTRLASVILYTNRHQNLLETE